MSNRRKSRPFANNRPTAGSGVIIQPPQLPSPMMSRAPDAQFIPGRQSGGHIAVAAPPVPSTTRVTLQAEYGADLPERGFTPFFRTQSFAASEVTSLPVGGFFQISLDEVPKGVGLLIYEMKFQWLEDGTDPFDPNALSPMQNGQALNGTVTVDFTVDGTPVVDQQSTLFDPSTSTATSVRGFARLNDNLISFGNSPSVVYVKQNTSLGARLYHNRTPGNPPAAFLVSVSGYSCPNKLLTGLIRRTRSYDN